jgi:hypothetical protein
MRDFIVNKLIGIALIIISLWIIAFAQTGTTLAERDITPLIITIPLAIVFLFSKGELK